MIIVLAIVGNKEDLYENEQVPKNEAINFAKEINAIFKKTSCKTSIGIKELFYEIGEHFLNHNLKITSNLTKDEILKERKRTAIQNLKNENKSKSKGCCY